MTIWRVFGPEYRVDVEIVGWKVCWNTSTSSQVSNCDGIVLEIYLDHKFQWTKEGLNCASLSYQVVTKPTKPSALTLTVQTLLWSLEFAIERNLEYNTIANKGLVFIGNYGKAITRKYRKGNDKNCKKEDKRIFWQIPAFVTV